MTGCDSLRVHALHDGTLTAETLDHALRHVAGCAACARELDELRALDALTREPIAVPEGYFDSLPARIAERARRTPPRALWARPTTWVSALAAALVIAFVTPRLLESPRPIPTPARAERAPALAADQATPAKLESLRPGAPHVDSSTAERDSPFAAPALPRAPRQQPLADRVEKAQAAGAAAPEPQAAAPPSDPKEEETRAGAQPPPASAVPVRAAASDDLVGAADLRADAPALSATAGLAAESAAPTTQKSARGASLTATPNARLLQARATRDRWAIAAQRPEERVGALRQAVDAAVVAVREGGDASDRAALRKLAEDYLTIADEGERVRVRARLAEFGLR